MELDLLVVMESVDVLIMSCVDAEDVSTILVEAKVSVKEESVDLVSIVVVWSTEVSGFPVC